MELFNTPVYGKHKKIFLSFGVRVVSDTILKNQDNRKASLLALKKIADGGPIVDYWCNLAGELVILTYGSLTNFSCFSVL